MSARTFLAAAATVGVCVCAWLCLSQSGPYLVGAAPSEPYTVAEVHAHLANDAQAWVNRRVLVRGIGGGCIPWAAPKDSPCVDEPPELVELGTAGITAIPIACGQVPPLLGFLRRIPWFGRRLSTPQILQPGTPGVYRIQLPAVPGYDAFLLDSTPNCGAG